MYANNIMSHYAPIGYCVTYHLPSCWRLAKRLNFDIPIKLIKIRSAIVILCSFITI